jgi:phosphatidylglycerol:prolipoprotein diacylglycerol transferase
MHPVLFQIGKISIHTYGFFIAMGFLTGIFLAKKEAKRLGEDHEKILDLCFYLLIAAIVGSRLFYVVMNPRIFVSDPMEIFRLWRGGLVFYGGFIAALITAIFYMKKRKMHLWKTADIMAPALSAGQFLGRLGCFSAGCCYGKACELPWAITFRNSDSLAPIGMALHPAQLYHALSNLLIFGLLWFFRGRKKFDGQLFWVYVLLYAVTRSFLEVFRGDFRGYSFWGVLSASQAVGSVMAVIAVVMLIRLPRSSHASIFNKKNKHKRLY